MSKARIYELAKELNTTSKRLMEKLSEINIDVKNHMSLLEEHELNALYKHIGIIKHDDHKGAEHEERKTVPPMPPKLAEARKDTKNAPRIIRKTEIVIDSKEEDRDGKTSARFDNSRNDNRNENKGAVKNPQNQSYVRSAPSTSGLRPGYVRDSGMDFKKDSRPQQRPDVKDPRNAAHSDLKEELKPVHHKEAEIVKTKEHKPEIAAEEKPEAKVEPKVTNEHKHEEVRDTAKPTELKEAKKEVTEKAGNNTENMSNVNAKVIDVAKSEEQVKPMKEAEPVTQEAPQVRSDRPQGDGYNRPQGDRPQGGYNRPYGDRPQGGYNRPQGDRPQGGGYNRPQGDRPQGGGYNRPQGDRPQGGGYNRPYGDRPQGGGYNRPQGDRPQGDRPQGDRPQGGYNRPYGDRPQGGS
ncbi:MAG: translation initiation factor IF-2 N-terminal domain-containing protein [Clostridia bacterium]|nr:translation initiation factor IF-2 N-terminal domain-containing protein [Clostridia bacterium]